MNESTTTKASPSNIANIVGEYMPITWQEAGRYAGEAVELATALAARINTLARRYPVATGGLLLGTAIAGYAGWRASAAGSPATAARMNRLEVLQDDPHLKAVGQFGQLSLG